MNKTKQLYLRAGFVAATMTASAANAAPFPTEFDYGGYIKVDTIMSDYSDGSVASGSIGRDFYVPATIPVGGESESMQFDMHARQSRFFFTTSTDVGNGEKIGSRLELDFIVTPNGNERISNSYTPRIRHGYITYDGFLFGQTWTTFMDVGALPESLDFIGSTDGTIFIRQTMVRYTYGGFQVAIENPETTVTPFGGGARVVTDDNSIPDLVVRYNHKRDWGHLTVSAIARQLSYEDNTLNIDDSTQGYGVSFTGKVMLGDDDVRFALNAGSGLGRYIGLNTANGAVLNAENELEAIDSLGFSVAYRHHWSNKWRSNVMYSMLNVDNETDLTGTGVTKETSSWNINLLYSPVKALTFGAEFQHANREVENGADGDMNRLQFSAKYAF